MIKLPANNNVPTPVVHDGQLYVSGGFGSKQYYAFDAKTGEKVWSVDLDDDGPSSGVVDNDVLVFNTESCTIFACDRKTGRYMWSYWLGDPLMSMPAVANGKVFTAYPAYSGYGNQFNTPQNNSPYAPNINSNSPAPNVTSHDPAAQLNFSHVLVAFELRTGKILWQKWIDGDIMSAPVAEGNDLYFSTFPGTVYKVDQSTGEFLSAKKMKATSAPVIKNGEMIVTRRNDKGDNCMESIATIDAQSTQVRGQYMEKEALYLDKNVQSSSQLKTIAGSDDAGNGFSSGAPVSSGYTYAWGNIGQSNVSTLQSFQGSRILCFDGRNYNTMGDELLCTDPATGNVIWRSKVDGDLRSVGGFLATPPVKAGDNIVIATYEGEIRVIDPTDGKITKRYSTGEHIRSQPVVQDGWIYVATINGKLVAVNTGDPKLTGWGMWGGNAARSNL